MAKLTHTIDLQDKHTKEEWEGQRRGESFYVIEKTKKKRDWYGLWAHDPILANREKYSFRRRFYKPQYGWPWEQEPPIVDVLDEGSDFLAPHYTKMASSKPSVLPISIVLEFHGFGEFPIVHVYKTFQEAWEFVINHPETKRILNVANVDPNKITYGEYASICDKYGSRTSTIFKINQRSIG